ncbi:IK family protein [Megaselia abdita]
MAPPQTDKSDARRKKKNFYAALKKQEDTKLQELSEKYRDRARERRDNANPDYQNAETPGHAENAYRAVPDTKSVFDAAERRKRIIQESKYLGGDMEHTHLVKGLDYALLQKVRSEIVTKEAEQEKELEREVEEMVIKEREKEEEKIMNEPEFKSVMAKNINNFISSSRTRQIVRNDLFLPGRMAYVIDLDDENNDTDIPTTLMRSKAEIPLSQMETQTLSTNDIVINKLSQILCYLRAGRGRKNKKRDKDKPLFLDSEDPGEKPQATGPVGESIYDDIGEYKAERNDKGKEKDRKDKRRYNDRTGRERERERDRTYKDDRRERDTRRREKSEEKEVPKRSYFGSSKDEDDYNVAAAPPPPKISSTLLTKFANEPEGYAECYPGLEEMNDAIDDSDDEADYTKMDTGNKKTRGRYDFETQEEYSDYMNAKEALPKAAFQFGVKMQDGRKSRKHKNEKNEKAELDREWQKIQNIIQKRKTKGGDEPRFKSSKFE